MLGKQGITSKKKKGSVVDLKIFDVRNVDFDTEELDSF